MSSKTCRGHDRTAPTHCQATLRAESRASMSVNHGARAQRCAPAVTAAHRAAPVRTRAGPRRSGRAADRGAHLGNSAAPLGPLPRGAGANPHASSVASSRARIQALRSKDRMAREEHQGVYARLCGLWRERPDARHRRRQQGFAQETCTQDGPGLKNPPWPRSSGDRATAF
jgi:hypothetical protein